jgi:integrase/recombinase XerC
MSTSLAQVHARFIEYLKAGGKANATVVAYGKDIEQLIDFVGKKNKVQVEDVNADDIEEFKELLKKQRYTGKSISRKINSIKAFFRFSVAEGFINDNPADIITHPKYDQTPPRV